MRPSFLLALPLLGLSTACSRWTALREYPRWTLFQFKGQAVAPQLYEEAFEVAFPAVEQALGPFEEHVAVHVWDGSGDARPPGVHVRTGTHEVPGIGPARIQAFHARGGQGLAHDGIFIGRPDAGTAVHELVHARFAELDASLPLWLEEGIAGFLGDGMLVDGKWVVDGLACWPLRELREERLSLADVERLVAIRPGDHTGVRDNVLVHFLGWAVVFDLMRSSGGQIDWRSWRISLGKATPEEILRHLERTLSEEGVTSWLERLADPRPEVRLATARGLWKLRQASVLDALLARLATEENQEVRVALAVNALAAAGEISLTWAAWSRVQRQALPVLLDAHLADPREEQAARELAQAQESGADPATGEAALRGLARFWEE